MLALHDSWRRRAATARARCELQRFHPQQPGRALAARERDGQSRAMRTVSTSATVRLYHLDDGDPVAETLFYGPLNEALAVARQQPDEVQAGLWIATDNDVVAYLDLDGG
jgi:hypothetical protein